MDGVSCGDPGFAFCCPRAGTSATMDLAYGPTAHCWLDAALLRALGPGGALRAGDPAAGSGEHDEIPFH